MTVNKTQREILDGFIGENGDYFETIKEYEDADLGTKILYLERAISEDCETFNKSLDKLYNSTLNDESLDSQRRSPHLNFISALKLINDLCFNNQVKFDHYGTRHALAHYFDSLGDVDVDAFRNTIQNTINAGIAALNENHDEVDAQKQARQNAEAGISGQAGWRIRLSLPLQQADYYIALTLDGALTEEQYQQLQGSGIKQVIANNIGGTRRLMLDFGATFDQLQELSGKELQEVFNLSPTIARLADQANIPAVDLLELNKRQFDSLIGHFRSYIDLAVKANIPFDTLLNLDPATRIEFLYYASEIVDLVTTANIPPNILLRLNPATRTEFFKYTSGVVDLVVKGSISPDTLLNLKPAMYIELARDARQVNRLMNEANITLANFLNADKEVRADLIKFSLSVVTLANRTSIPDNLSVLAAIAKAFSPVELFTLPIEQLNAMTAANRLKKLRKILSSLSSDDKPSTPASLLVTHGLYSTPVDLSDSHTEKPTANEERSFCLIS